MSATSFDRVNSYELPYPPRFIPANPSFFNYEIAFTNMPLVQYLINTLAIVILSVVLTVAISTLTGFCLSKGRFKGKGLILLIILSNMMIPFETKLMPTFMFIRAIGLTNTYMGVVLPHVLTTAMYIFYIKKFCDDLPDDLYEAGIIDGASKFRIYGQIFLPLMGPVIATIIILNVMNCWNDLLWPLIVLTKTNMKTIQIGLSQYSFEQTSHAGVATALSVVSVIPLTVIFVFLQKYIIQSIAATGIKQ
jgi:multiple sugar transport system permease protein